MKIPKIYAKSVAKSKIDLTLSVNPLGCSPRVLKTLKRLTMKDVSSYPNQQLLITHLSRKFKVQENNILLGCGSEQLIKLVTQTFLEPKDMVLVENGSFALFTKESLLAGGVVKLCTLEELVTTKARLVFIANPKTPTGEIIPRIIFDKILQNNNSVIVVDEANGELIANSVIPQAVKSKNILVLRTFSKTLGLAGLRLGFVVGPIKLISRMQKSQQPFPVSQIAVKLGLSAIQDSKFLIKTRSFITQERKFLQAELSKLGLNTSNSVTNNIFITYAQTGLLINELNKRNVTVINGNFFPGMIKRGFRISIKDRDTNKKFLNILRSALACIKRQNLLRSKEVL